MSKEHTEEEHLKNLIKTTFLNGALNALNIEDLEKGVHKDFAILIAKGENLVKLDYLVWLDVLKTYKENPEKINSGIRNVDYEFKQIDITGNSAVVKVQLFRDKEVIVTDYISFLKFSDGWKAVAKVSNDHIPNPFNL